MLPYYIVLHRGGGHSLSNPSGAGGCRTGLPQICLQESPPAKLQPSPDHGAEEQEQEEEKSQSRNLRYPRTPQACSAFPSRVSCARASLSPCLPI